MPPIDGDVTSHTAEEIAASEDVFGVSDGQRFDGSNELQPSRKIV
jgi:hypothetical protein